MDMAKCLKVWWPRTELNRRRQPFQTRISSVSNNFKGCVGLPNTGKYDKDERTVGDCRG